LRPKEVKIEDLFLFWRTQLLSGKKSRPKEVKIFFWEHNFWTRFFWPPGRHIP